MSEKDSGPAFPCHEALEQFDDELGRYEEIYLPSGGMSLRDYFACQALSMSAVMLAAKGAVSETAIQALVAMSYMVADAMLKERAK